MKRWGEFDVSSWRKTWISCYGLPLHLWSSENFNMIAQIWGKLLSLDTSTDNLLSFEGVRMCILKDSMSSIAKEIIVEEGQGSHIVSILEDGCLGTPLMYSTKVEAMKGKVVVTHSIDKVFSDKAGNNCIPDVQGVDNHRSLSLARRSTLQPEMEISGENVNGRPASIHPINGSGEDSGERAAFANSGDNFQGKASCNSLETREDALAISATSSPVPIISEPCFPVTPILPSLILEIGPNVVPTPQQVVSNFESIVPVSSKEPRLGLGHYSCKEHSKKKKVKKKLKQGRMKGSLARKRRVDFSKAIREYQLSKAPNNYIDLGADVEQPSFKPKKLEAEKLRSNSISTEELFDFAKNLGVPFIGDEET
ncbi:LOW QUALITY PROTEIN: hypothetical protein Cgig2_015218 [Carnegiea gigantea]|uniref:DUF4283 domain-containing protein n=1 Tax=Carnegiea gigantea TaxID=171969 RepID=A0A9Q1JNV3_9CARY|nr:LOW QUALITY PROTEIN: hypothetical protein Cgig2_015218 [Carnegiea gigantea]